MPRLAKVELKHNVHRFLRGHWIFSDSAKRVCIAVPCPKCKAAATWPCFSLTSGTETPTPHSARWEAYGATQNAANAGRT